MRLCYQSATIGLTAPNSEVIAVASLLIGEVEGRRIAGIALVMPDHLDPLTAAVLNDTPQLVRRYVDEACARSGAALGDLLARVSRSLRDSVRVSAIDEPAEVEVSAVGELGGAVVNMLHRRLVVAGGELPQSLVWGPPAYAEQGEAFGDHDETTVRMTTVRT